MTAYQGIIWAASLKSARDEARLRVNRLRSSLASLKKNGDYAQDHKMLIAMWSEISAVIDKHGDAAGTILPPPAVWITVTSPKG